MRYTTVSVGLSVCLRVDEDVSWCRWAHQLHVLMACAW